LREYETTFIVQPEISDEGCQELLTRVDAVLEREGATRLLHDDQGKRKLAYEIRKFQKGRYVTTQYLDYGKAVAPLERALRLEESVLRFLTVQVTDRVEDIEHRKALAAEEERIRAERARERAAREAEEEKARQQAAMMAPAPYPEREDDGDEAGNADAEALDTDAEAGDADAEALDTDAEALDTDAEAGEVEEEESEVEGSETRDGGER
jgi:small subunit ribosomal protein S6